MSDAASPSPDFEGLLRRALAPVEPPEDFALRIEQTLQTITDMAAEELEAWEAGAMVDPRNSPTPTRRSAPPGTRPGSCSIADGGARK
jgi:hypothetical protein